MKSTESILFTPFKLGPITLRNRTMRAAAFEGMCPGNKVILVLLPSVSHLIISIINRKTHFVRKAE